MKKLLLMLIAVMSSYSLHAQDSGFGLGVKVVLPQGKFRENIGNEAISLAFSKFSRVKNSRFSLGGEIGLAKYNSDSYDTHYRGDIISVTEDDGFYTLNGYIRYNMVQRPGFAVYSELNMGVTAFYSELRAEDCRVDFEGEHEFHGAAFTLGSGMGVLVNPVVMFSKNQTPSNIWLKLAFNSFSSSDSQYRMRSGDAGTISLTDAIYNSSSHYLAYTFSLIVGI